MNSVNLGRSASFKTEAPGTWKDSKAGTICRM